MNSSVEKKFLLELNEDELLVLIQSLEIRVENEGNLEKYTDHINDIRGEYEVLLDRIDGK